ncbi:MAG TPA: hypothetical protein ACFCUY_08665 [Xenococcaceae cyanobacterium]
MELNKIKKQVLELPICDRWDLVQSLLISIQQETLSSISPSPTIQPLTNLDPWTQSLIGVIELNEKEATESYLDYLEEKYS